MMNSESGMNTRCRNRIRYKQICQHIQSHSLDSDMLDTPSWEDLDSHMRNERNNMRLARFKTI